MLVPTGLAITFNVLTHAAIFVTISYTFELCADIVSIFKDHVFSEKKAEKILVENENIIQEGM